MEGERTPLLPSTPIIQNDQTRDIPTEGAAQIEHDAENANKDAQKKEPVSSAYTLLGFFSAILAGLCFTSTNVMVKFAPDLSSWQLLLVRCTMQLAAMAPIMWCTKSPLLPPDFATKWKVLVQGILGGFLLLSIFVAVNRLPLGDATAIFFSSPAFTMVLSAILLRDHCGLYRTFIAIILLIGVVVLCRPEALFPPSSNHHLNSSSSSSPSSPSHGDPHSGSYDLVGIVAGLCVPLLSAWIVILTRQARHVHYSVLVFWFGLGGLTVSVLGNLYAADPKVRFSAWSCTQWILAILIGVLGILGSIVMNKAVKWVTPSKVMVIRSFEVVAAYILQITVFKCPTHWTDLGGTCLVMAAVLGMGLEDVVMEATGSRYL